MRILLTHHFPIGQNTTGRFVSDLAQALLLAEHEVRVICVGGAGQHGTLAVQAIECACGGSKFKLPFNLPWFGVEPDGEMTFEQLTSDQLSEYRNVLRHELDVEVDAFDPQIIHAQHIWLWGQLALESGVPYVLSAWGPELVCRARDNRYRPLADQAAENAGRIFVPDEHVRREVLNTFDDIAERAVLLPAKVDENLVVEIVNHYQAVLDDRFGMTL